MHGAAMARVGRKRKSGRRHANGELAHPAVNYGALAALQPHRRSLPVNARLSQDATTELGRAFLRGQITEAEHLAGQEYARRIGQYRATVCGPRTTAGAGRWSGCNPDLCRFEGGDCECLRRRRDYQEFQEVIAKAGRRVEMAVNRVVAHDQTPIFHDIYLLSLGLSALARHMRLTNRQKNATQRN